MFPDYDDYDDYDYPYENLDLPPEEVEWNDDDLDGLYDIYDDPYGDDDPYFEPDEGEEVVRVLNSNQLVKGYADGWL